MKRRSVLHTLLVAPFAGLVAGLFTRAAVAGELSPHRTFTAGKDAGCGKWRLYENGVLTSGGYAFNPGEGWYERWDMEQQNERKRLTGFRWRTYSSYEIRDTDGKVVFVSTWTGPKVNKPVDNTYSAPDIGTAIMEIRVGGVKQSNVVRYNPVEHGGWYEQAGDRRGLIGSPPGPSCRWISESIIPSRTPTKTFHVFGEYGPAGYTNDSQVVRRTGDAFTVWNRRSNTLIWTNES